MKLFYLASLEQAMKIQHEWHSLDLGNGEHLICVRWRDEGHETEWAAQEGVVRLPHPIFQSQAVIAEEYRQTIKGRFELPENATVHDVINAAVKDDSWMRLHVL